MAGKRQRRNVNIDWQAAEKLELLLADRGWVPKDVQDASTRTGRRERTVSQRVVYRVINEGHKPTAPVQFEIAATLDLLPSHIWGKVPISEATYLSGAVAVAA